MAFAISLLSEVSSPIGLTPIGYGWALIKMTGALMIVCLLAYIFLRWIRRYSMNEGSPKGYLQLLDRCPLSPRQNLWIIKAGDRIFLVGSHDGPGGSVAKLAELDSSIFPENYIEQQKPEMSFWKILNFRRQSSGACNSSTDKHET